MKYKCLLFDLDHTLWDYEINSREALSELYYTFELSRRRVGLHNFLDTFYVINNELWDQYDRGLLHRDVIRNERFHKILLALGVDDLEMSLALSHQYINESPKKKNLIEGCREVLDYFRQRYTMIIVTNGFEEIQATKLSSSGIDGYFKCIVTSARAGSKKPAREIFDFALSESNFSTNESIMIGDNLLTDIAGAANAGIDTVYFNPNSVPHQVRVNYEITSLRELMNFL